MDNVGSIESNTVVHCDVPSDRVVATQELDSQDFEVLRTEESTRSATVLMVDQSLSMFFNGYFEAAKRVIAKGMALVKSVSDVGLYARHMDYVALIRLKRRQGDIAGAFAAIEQMERLKPEDKSIIATLRARLWLAQAMVGLMRSAS